MSSAQCIHTDVVQTLWWESGSLMSDPSELNICVFTCTEKGSGLHVHGRKLLQTADSHFRTMRARPSEKQNTKISKIAASEVGGVFFNLIFQSMKILR